ncbi:hypothetical protein ES705_40575 [subsurface metagenome]
MNDLRTELAQEWAKEHHIQLSLFNREYQIELKATSRERKLNKESSEKAREICQGIEGNKGNLDEKEFKEMCKKAGVEPGSLAKTVFTESIKNS